MTLVVARRYKVLGLLAGASALAWGVGTVAIEGLTAEVAATGGHPIEATLAGYGLGLQVTLAWAAGALMVHAVVGVLAWRHRDREAAIGLGWSVVFHLAFMVGQGALSAGVG